MKYPYTLEQLQDCKKQLERDIAWYEQPNRPGVELSDEYRKERIGELQTQRLEIDTIIELLSSDRFNAIVDKLIDFNLIEANLMVLASMVRKIGNPKQPKMKQECLRLIQDMLGKYFTSLEE